jgi:Fe-S-cluster-containing dehydrogenase component
MLELPCHSEGEQVMNLDRRKFLKIGGMGIFGFIAKPLIDFLIGTESGLASETMRRENAPGYNISADSRWAMLINAGKCKKGCTDCMNACHRIHNVPEIKDPKNEIKWIWSEPFENAFPDEHEYIGGGFQGKPVPILCNHCDNPPCVRVCPTKATWRRDDGIVMMDYHRCIGCRFCMAACPYGSRSFNWKDPRPHIRSTTAEFPTRTKGVVEKCNFCEERLAVGKIPACVEACKNKAMIFGDIRDPGSEIRKAMKESYSIRRKPGLGTAPQIYYIV